MLRQIIKRWLTIIVLFICALEAAASQGGRDAQGRDSVPDVPLLSAEDKAQLSEALRLQMALGDQLWRGLGRAHIPIILSNDRYEFLIGETNPPAPWVAVKGDSFNGKSYYHRDASNPQYFAVQVGEGWAGSIGTLDWMNKKSPLKLSRDFHVALILHEMFHAYQAAQSSERFKQALMETSERAKQVSHDKWA
jgi:hypothetical protein